MATSTPWGPSQQSKKHAVGIVEYSCAGHGGFHVSKTLNAQIHPAWRKANGWYEEDCEWAIVAVTFPQAFADKLGQARNTAKEYFPHAYMKATGDTVELHESRVLRNEADRVKHANSWIIVAAYGDWEKGVPKGMVGGFASKGGRDKQGHYSDETKWFLVPAKEYGAKDNEYLAPEYRCSLGFIVDPTRHQENRALVVTEQNRLGTAHATFRFQKIRAQRKEGETPAQAIARSLSRRVGDPVTLWPAGRSPVGEEFEAKWYNSKEDVYEVEPVTVYTY